MEEVKGTTTVTIREVDLSLHKAIKKAAVDRGVNVNDLYKMALESGVKRRGIVADVK